jgi:hypothetical protein
MDLWDALADGSVTVAFRRWRRPSVKAGGTLKFPRGVLAIDAVQEVDEHDITPGDARAAGAESRAALLDALARRPGTLYRVDFHFAGEDPRVALRERAVLATDELDAVVVRLARFDTRSTHGPWTLAVLEAIDAEPGRRAPELAEGFGRETAPFKTDVRKLKELGLTESLPVGYRISPRGATVLAELRRRRDRDGPAAGLTRPTD